MPDEPAAIMIFAAGFGTRMGALTKPRPKPLIEVAGRALIDHTLDIAAPLKLPITVNAHYHAEMLARHLSGQSNVTLSHEAPEILETGGGLKHALPAMPPGAVLTLNSDALWAGPNPLEQLRRDWDPTRMEALLLLVPKPRCVAYTRDGNFSMGEAGELYRDPLGLVYTGAHITKPDRIAAMPERAFSLNAVWDQMIAEGTIFGTIYPGKWADIGTPDGIPAGEAMLRDV